MTQQKTDIQLTNWEIVSVNPSDKQWSWKTLFCFWGNSVQSIIGFSLIASLYLVYDLNFLVVLSGSLIGSIFVYFLCNPLKYYIKNPFDFDRPLLFLIAD